MSTETTTTFEVLGNLETSQHRAQEQFAKQLWARLLNSKGSTPGKFASVLWTNDLVAVTQKDVYGSGTIVVGPDMEALFFGSALKDAKAAEAYLKGRRTPMTNFEKRGSSRR